MLWLFALLLVARVAPPRRQLPIDELPAERRVQAAEVQSALEKYPHNSCVLYQAAALCAKAGRSAEVLATLRRMAGLHAGLDPRLRDGFQSLADDPEFQRLKQQIRRGNPAIREANRRSR